MRGGAGAGGFQAIAADREIEGGIEADRPGGQGRHRPGCSNAEVRVVAQGGPWLPGTTRTDADGNFDFNTLGEATYQIYVNGAYFIHRDTVNSGLIKDTQYQQKEFRAGWRPICCWRSHPIRAASWRSEADKREKT